MVYSDIHIYMYLWIHRRHWKPFAQTMSMPFFPHGILACGALFRGDLFLHLKCAQQAPDGNCPESVLLPNIVLTSRQRSGAQLSAKHRPSQLSLSVNFLGITLELVIGPQKTSLYKCTPDLTLHWPGTNTLTWDTKVQTHNIASPLTTSHPSYVLIVFVYVLALNVHTYCMFVRPGT